MRGAPDSRRVKAAAGDFVAPAGKVAAPEAHVDGAGLPVEVAASRRAAKQATTPEEAEKIRRSANTLEKTALAKVGQAGPGIGTLLDTFA